MLIASQGLATRIIFRHFSGGEELFQSFGDVGKILVSSSGKAKLAFKCHHEVG